MKLFKNKKVLSILLFFVPMLIGIPVAMLFFPSNKNSIYHSQKQDTCINQQLKSDKQFEKIEEKIDNILYEIVNLKLELKKIMVKKDTISHTKKQIETKNDLQNLITK